MKKYMGLILLLSLVMVSCDESVTSQEEGPPPGISPCEVNENCLSGQICSSGSCVSAPTVPTDPSVSTCTSDSGCQAGYYCSNSSCVPQTPPAQTCTNDSGCQAGYSCSNGSCVPQTPPAQTCASDSGCQAGYSCSNGNCIAKAAPQPTVCSSDEGCPAGQKCESGACKPYGSLNTPCKEGGGCDPGLGCNASKICLGKETWTHLGKPVAFPVLASNGAVTRSGNVTYVGTLSGVVKTSDGGLTWLPVNNSLPGSAPVTALLTVGQNVYAGLYGEGIYVTNDGGLNWSPLNSGLSDLGKFVTGMIKVQTKSGLFYAGTRDGVFFASGPTPTEWKSMGLNGLYIRNLAYYNSKLYATVYDLATLSSKGLFVYESKNNWSELNDGLKDPETGALKQIYSMAVSSQLGLIVAAKDGIYKWKLLAKQGGLWVPAFEMATTPGILTVVGDDIYIAAVYDGVLYKYSGDKLLTIGIEGKPIINSITPIDGKLFVATSGGIYKTNADNIKWELIEFDIGYDNVLGSLLVNNTLVVGTDSRSMAYSSNGGTSWTYLQLGDKYHHIARIKQNDNMTYALSSHVLQSVDGINWQPMSESTLYKARDLVFFDNSIFVANGKDVLKYSVGYKGEDKLNPLPSEAISLAVFKGEIYAGTMNGLYKLVAGNWVYVALQDVIVTALFPYENDLYAGSFAGVHRLSYIDDVAGLQSQGAKLEGLKIADIKAFGNDIYAATTLGLYKTPKTGGDWSKVKEMSDVGFITSLFATKDMLFAGTMGLGLYVFVP